MVMFLADEFELLGVVMLKAAVADKIAGDSNC